jgi:PAS domain S-box-containing protein
MMLPVGRHEAPTQKKIILAFRLQTVLVVMALLASSNGGLLLGSQAFKIAYLYLASNLLLIAIPSRYFRLPALTGTMLVADVAFVSVCIHLSASAGGDLYLLYFLAIFTAALTRDLKATIVAAIVVSAVYLWVSSTAPGATGVFTSSFLLRVPLFFVTAFFTGFLANQAREREEERRMADMATSELAQQLEQTKRHGEKTLDRYRDLYIHHRNIMTSINSAIVVVDEKGMVSTFNREAERITGLSVQETVGRPAARFAVIKPLADSLALAQSSGKLSSSAEVRLEAEDGRVIPIGFSTSLLRDQGNRVTGAIATFRDLSEINELRGQIQRSERLAFLGEMAVSMAHEIRNPLNSISGFAQLLCERTDPQEQFHQFAEIIVDETKRVDKIVSQTLHFVKDDSIPFESLDFNEVINSTVAGLQDKLAECSMAVTLDLNPYLPYVLGNALQLQQVCANLITNAIQALGGGGEMRITTDLEDGVIRARFADNGPGIPKAIRDKVFNPFFTTKTNGTGLGLAISQKILTDHRGSVGLVDGTGRGAVFEIRLPSHEVADNDDDYLKPSSSSRAA